MITLICADGTLVHLPQDANIAIIENAETGFDGVFPYDRIVPEVGQLVVAVRAGLFVPLTSSPVAVMAIAGSQ